MCIVIAAMHPLQHVTHAYCDYWHTATHCYSRARKQMAYTAAITACFNYLALSECSLITEGKEILLPTYQPVLELWELWEVHL